MRKKVVHRLSHLLHMQHQSNIIIHLFWRFSVDKIFTREAAQEKKATQGGTFDNQTKFQGNNVLYREHIAACQCIHIYVCRLCLSINIHTYTHMPLSVQKHI